MGTDCALFGVMYNYEYWKRSQGPPLYGVLVPAGLEQGTDLLLDSTTIGASPFITTVLEEAQSLGLICTCITSVFVISFRPWLASRGYTTQTSKHLLQGSGSAEAFLRGGGKVSPRHDGAGDMNLHRSNSAAESLGGLMRSEADRGSGCRGANSDGVKESLQTGPPGLGMHLALVALPCFFSFLLVLTYHVCEVKYRSTLSSTFFSVRLFRVSMVTALGLLVVLHRRAPSCSDIAAPGTKGFDSLWL